MTGAPKWIALAATVLLADVALPPQQSATFQEPTLAISSHRSELCRVKLRPLLRRISRGSPSLRRRPPISEVRRRGRARWSLWRSPPPLPLSKASANELWFVSLAAASAPKPLAGPWSTTRASVNPRPWAQISPDGRWIAFVSGVSGRNEVYVQPFPAGDVNPRQVSEQGGIEPQWRADGRELFFLASDKQLMAVPIVTDGALRTRTPSALFMTGLDLDRLGVSGRNQYLASPSGDQFLINQSRPGAEPPPIVVLLNWSAASRD